jgi:hypothetical protein
MFNYSFLRLSDGATISLPADNDAMALALLGQREHVQLSMAGEGSPEYMFAKSDQHTFWCRPNTPVYQSRNMNVT